MTCCRGGILSEGEGVNTCLAIDDIDIALVAPGSSPSGGRVGGVCSSLDTSFIAQRTEYLDLPFIHLL